MTNSSSTGGDFDNSPMIVNNTLYGNWLGDNTAACNNWYIPNNYYPTDYYFYPDNYIPNNQPLINQPFVNQPFINQPLITWTPDPQIEELRKQLLDTQKELFIAKQSEQNLQEKVKKLEEKLAAPEFDGTVKQPYPVRLKRICGLSALK